MLYRPGLLGRMPCPMDWYAGSGAPTIDNDFMSGALPGLFNLTRAGAVATNCVYTDSPTAPAYTVYSANQPRWLDLGLLIEPQRTNLFLNSEAPVTQNITVTAGTIYTVWVMSAGGGTVSLTGMAGLVGTPISQSQPYTFTASANGSVTVTCSAPLTRVQFENGPTPTSYIPTGGSAAPRSEDRVQANFLGGQLNVAEGTYWVEWAGLGPSGPQNGSRIMTAGVNSYTSDGGTDQIDFLTGVGSGSGMSFIPGYEGQADTLDTYAALKINRIAMSVKLGKTRIASNYVLGNQYSPTARPPTLLGVTLGGGGTGYAFSAYMRGFKYWPVAMPDAELKECTGAGYYGGKPVFDLDLKTVLPRRMTFARAATTGVSTDATWADAPGSGYNTFAAPPAARFSSRGLMMEVARNNYFPVGNAPISRTSIAVVANQSYKVSIIGTGSVTITPGTSGIAVGSGAVATQGNPACVTTDAAGGNLTLTVTGSVTRAQMEQLGAGAFRGAQTSFIQNTTALQSRGGENLNMPVGAWWSGQARTYFLEVWMYDLSNTGTLMSCGSADNASREQIFQTAPTQSVAGSPVNISYENIIAGGPNDSAITIAGFTQVQRIYKFAGSWTPSKRTLAINGVVSSAAPNTGVKPQPALLVLNTALNQLTAGYGSQAYRRFAFWDYALSDDQLVTLTT